MSELKTVVVFNGQIINVGAWDSDEPIPTGATEEQREMEYSLEFGWRESGTLKPPTIEEQLADKDRQIIELTKMHSVTNQLIIENNLVQQDLIELLIDMGVI